VVLRGGAATVTVPSDWEVADSGDDFVSLWDPLNDWVDIEVLSLDPADAAASITQKVASDVVLHDEHYTNVKLSTPVTVEAEGSIADHAWIYYKGVWTDQQGSEEIEGFIIALEKADGTTLIVWTEYPLGTAEEHVTTVAQVTAPAIASFESS
jgi:hypothetical protein